MKKIVCCLVALSLLFALAGCGSMDETDSREFPEENEEISSIQEPVVHQDPISLTESDVQITRQDLSIKNDDGTILINIYYDLVQLPDTNDSFRAINAGFQEEFNSFKSILDEIREYGYDTAAESSYQQRSTDWHPYEDTYTASVSYCSDGLLSVTYDTTWNMGGVGNGDRYGLVYNYINGEKYTLEALEKNLPPNGNLKEYVDSKVIWYLEDNKERTDDAVRYMGECTLSDYDICIEDKQIILLTHNYGIARGPRRIPLDLYIDTIGNESEKPFKDVQWDGINRASLDEADYMPIMSLNSDGSFVLWGAYSASDAGNVLEGTYSLEKGIVSFKGSRSSNYVSEWKDVDVQGTYQLACIGDCVQLTQVDEDLMYGAFPAGTVWTFRTYEQ